MAKTGPKAAALPDALDLGAHRKKSKGFEDFCRRYVPVRTPAGPKPIRIRKWQLDIVASFFDTGPVRLAGLQIGRGNGKTTLCAALALWEIFAGQYGANVVCCAVDERQATILYEAARWMVENSPELAARALIYKDRIVVPARSATLRVLPAEAKRLEGLDFSLAILDEAGFASNDTFATLLDAQGKREQSCLVLIGTPGPLADSPLGRLREQARSEPDDALTAFVSFDADDYRSHPWDCEHCLALANPAWRDFLHASGVDAARPPKTPEARWRRVRLGQWITGDGDGWLDRALWDAVAESERLILPGAPVVLGLDGSRSDDATALVMVSIEARPVVQLVGLWEPRLHDESYRVPVLAVEDRIRQLSDIYNVREITGDPFGWSRTFEVLREQGFTVTEFPNTRERTTPAIAAFKQAVLEHELSHDENPKLAAHVSNAVIEEWARGYTIRKATKNSPKKIDAAISAVMAFTRAKWHASRKPASNRLYVF